MNKKTPRWMANYETGEGQFEEENQNVMMMMTENGPVSFEEVVMINTGEKLCQRN